MSRIRCKTCKGKGPCESNPVLECRSYEWNGIPYKGEQYGYKCMRCMGCNTIHQNTLWYAADNRHYCPICEQWVAMVNLDSEEFNPSRRWNE